METKQEKIQIRREAVREAYDEAVFKNKSITKLVNRLALEFDVTPITIYADVYFNKNGHVKPKKLANA